MASVSRRLGTRRSARGRLGGRLGLRGRIGVRLGVAFWLSILWIALLVFLGVFEEVLPIRDPDAKGIRTGEVERFEGPGWNAWFGGGPQGEDQLSRIIAGIRPALTLGLVVTALAALIGSALGVLAGYARGRIDAVTTAAIDVALAFPALVLLIAVRSTFGNSLLVFTIIFTITGIPPYARIVRGATLALAERDFVDAARSMGASRRRIVFRELAPNLVLPVLSFAAIGFAIVILSEGALAFLGLSIDQTTWGALIAEGTGEIRSHPHVALIPATVMFLTILAFNLVGDGLRDLTAPRVVATVRRLEVEGEHIDATGEPVLHVHDLHTTLHTPLGHVEAVDGVTFDLSAGEALGIVGESGSGKTMVLRSIVGAFPLAGVTRAGTVDVCGVDMLRAPRPLVQHTLGTRIGMVSQNPLTALNPTRRIEVQITEPMIVHGGLNRRQARDRALELMRHVGIPAPERRLREYPHQLSGGMRQRVTIAIALANGPQVLLADEPTTALDVTVQSQILELLGTLRREDSMALVLVTHDLAVVRGFTDRVAIMYAGHIVEQGPTEEIFSNPQHQYTMALMRSMPDLDLPSHSRLRVIEGSPPSLVDLPPGCRFASRCPLADDRCHAEDPEPTGTPRHGYRCFHPGVEAPVEVGHGR